MMVILALVLDQLIGDPRRFHPVSGMGLWISWLEQRFNRGRARRLKGALAVSAAIVVPVAIATSLSLCAMAIHPYVGMIINALITSFMIAERSLREAALAVYRPLSEGDLAGARLAVSMIVGRETSQLDEGQVVRAAVETVAENSSDGITAPLFWALIGGVPFVVAYRVINTLDAMIGHRNERYEQFGYVAAKLDDAANYIPSRLTALCMAVVARSHYSIVRLIHLAWRDGKQHPSPNSGQLEAMMAYLLQTQLGGPITYKGVASFRAVMGEARQPLQREMIVRATIIVRRTVILFVCLGVMIHVAATSWR